MKRSKIAKKLRENKEKKEQGEKTDQKSPALAPVPPSLAPVPS